MRFIVFLAVSCIYQARLADQLVIEHMSRSDDKVETLLRNKEDLFHDYSRDNFVAALARHFSIRKFLPLESENR